MKCLKLAIILMVALLPYNAFCQSETTFEFTPISDDNVFWPTDKNKASEVVFKKDLLILKNKLQDHYLSTLAKVSLDFKGNVVVGGSMIPNKVDDKHRFGFIFNGKNDENFHAIVFDKKYAYYLIAERGHTTLEERALYKHNKNSAWTITVTKEYGKYIVRLNDMEIFELYIENLTGNKIGFYTDNKSMLCVLSFLAVQTGEATDE